MSAAAMHEETGSRFAGFLPGVSLVVFAAASLALFSERAGEPAPKPEAGGKMVERLSFVQEDVPTRQTRIYDTLAMFSLPQAEPVAWSEAAPVRDVVTVAVVGDAAAKAAEAPAPRRSAATTLPAARPVPPSRPVELASAALAPRAMRPGPMPSLVQPLAVASAAPAPQVSAGPARTALQVLGVELPGTQYLPTGGETLRKITGFGAKTREMTVNAGSSVTDAFSAATDALADTVGLR